MWHTFAFQYLKSTSITEDGKMFVNGFSDYSPIIVTVRFDVSTSSVMCMKNI